MGYARVGQFTAKRLLALVLQSAVACLLLADTAAGNTHFSPWAAAFGPYLLTSEPRTIFVHVPPQQFGWLRPAVVH